MPTVCILLLGCVSDMDCSGYKDGCADFGGLYACVDLLCTCDYYFHGEATEVTFPHETKHD